MIDESSLSEKWLQSLQASGYRLTQPLRILVEILAKSPRALSPMDLFDLGRKEFPKMGLVTVYRALEKLEEQGLVQRVHQPCGCNMYLRAANGHEHLLLCTSCGRAEYFRGDDLSPLTDSLTRRFGFDIREHWLQIYGVCPACLEREETAPSSAVS